MEDILVKAMLTVIIILCGVIGYFVKEMLNDIKGKQKDHTVSLTNIRQHVLKTEDRTNTLAGEVSKLREITTAYAVTQRETKAMLDHNLTELRQQIKDVTQEQGQQKREFGKVILIVQKLYSSIKGGSSS